MTQHIPHPFIQVFGQIDPSDHSILGRKAVNLGLLIGAGLPVPRSFYITTEAYDFFTTHKNLPNGLVAATESLREVLGGKIALRSSATCEDGEALSMAGVFQSCYVRENDDVQATLEKIYIQVKSKESILYMKMHNIDMNSVKMGIIIQKLIEPEFAGVIYTGINSGDILVQYVDGFGVRLVDGETHGSAVILSADSKIIAESVNYELRPLGDDAINQIVHFSEVIQRLFKRKYLDIEFAYRDEKVYILQTRTLTTELVGVSLEESIEETLEVTKRRFHQLADEEKRELGTTGAIFSTCNFSELLPQPAEMDCAIFASIFTGIDGRPGATHLGRREMGYLLEEESVGFMQYIGGRPYYSVAKDAATFYAGFPETREEYFKTLVNEYLLAIQKDPERGMYPEMGLYLQDPTLEDLRMRYGDKAQDYYKVYQHFVTRMNAFAYEFAAQLRNVAIPELVEFAHKLEERAITGLSNPGLVDYIDQILEHLRTVSCVNFVKAARLGFYFTQRIQLELKNKLNLEGDELAQKVSQILQGLEGSKATEVNIAIAEANSTEEALIASNTHTSDMYIGHYSAFEVLEIRHSRYKDHIEGLQAYIHGIRQTGKYEENFEKRKNERLKMQENLLALLPEEEREEAIKIIKSARTYMALRETIKYYFTREYTLIRDALELLEDRLGLEKGDIYHTYPKELGILVNDTRAMKHIIRSRKQAFQNYRHLELPMVIRESDIDDLGQSLDDQDNVTQLSGKFLAAGTSIEGIIINLDDFEGLDKAEASIKDYTEQGIPIILAVRQMNLGHDPLIMSASGLIIENAGIVSHGAQRARELGRGAIGGIKSRYLKTGTRVYFDPAHKIVRKVE